MKEGGKIPPPLISTRAALAASAGWAVRFASPYQVSPFRKGGIRGDLKQEDKWNEFKLRKLYNRDLYQIHLPRYFHEIIALPVFSLICD